MNRKKHEKTEQITKKPSIKGNIIGLLVCVPFLIFGIAMIGVSVKELSFTASCKAETTGTVDSVSCEREIERMSSNHRHYIKSTYTAQYTYELDGKLFNDTLITSKRVKEGQVINIRYDPEHPETKYVKGYDDAGDLLPMIFGIVWDGVFLFIMYCLIITLREKLSKRNEMMQYT